MNPYTDPMRLAVLQAEQERLIFHDPDPVGGFMLHPDLKWVRLAT